MKMILKPIFELLTGDVMIFNNIICNYIGILVVGEVAYQIAKSFVRDMYHIGVINVKIQGSIIHWIVRLFVYFICAYILRFIIWFINFVATIPLWVWITIALSIILIIALLVYLKTRKAGESSDRRNKTANRNDKLWRSSTGVQKD